MGLSATGKKLVQYGIELLDVKEELLNLSYQEASAEREMRLARLEHRKKKILDEVKDLSDMSVPPERTTQ
jgi:hypothetical protein